MRDSLPPKRLLIVDDEPSMRDTLSLLFRRESYDVSTAPGVQSAIELIDSAVEPFPVVLTDLRMPDGDGLMVLEAAKARSPATEVIVMTAYHDQAFDAMRKGAYDFVAKPFPSLREVVERIGKAYEKANIVAENVILRARVVDSVGARPWVARSPAMQKVLAIVDKVAATRTTVLITGGSGTGKERVARLLHDRSDRASKPFLVVNCGALPEGLMESELFGHEKGAFTGASSRHVGMLREAHGGTLLLDEIGELPMPLQVKLLRVLQE
ncbi:MAG TPA: sigma-54 dependent transcriptional regulator, partial [Polyangiaceae bacterium]|nr:sigma-54 dependent transcriptional regulator [Polyangiaceae bacterium]